MNFSFYCSKNRKRLFSYFLLFVRQQIPNILNLLAYFFRKKMRSKLTYYFSLNNFTIGNIVVFFL